MLRTKILVLNFTLNQLINYCPKSQTFKYSPFYKNLLTQQVLHSYLYLFDKILNITYHDYYIEYPTVTYHDYYMAKYECLHWNIEMKKTLSDLTLREFRGFHFLEFFFRRRRFGCCSLSTLFGYPLPCTCFVFSKWLHVLKNCNCI